MRKEDFKTALLEWNKLKFPDIISRDYKIPLKSSSIVSLVGVRRSGKTYLLLSLAKKLLEDLPKDNVIYLNFEHELLRNLDAKNLREFIEAYSELYEPIRKPKYLLLDEIQNVSDWEKWLRRIYDQRDFVIYITGSSSKLSPKEIAYSLRGRTINYTIYPFSFREFLVAKNFGESVLEIEHLEEKKGKMLRLLREYLEFGGFPEIVLKRDNIEKIKLLQSYFDTIIYRDVIEKFRIREARLLEDFIRYAMNNSSSYFSVTRAEKFFKSTGERGSKKTFSDFLKFANSSFLIFPVEIFSTKIKNRMLYPKKLYCIDQGLINFVNPRFSENLGKLMENVCYIELRRKKEFGMRYEIYYWKDAQQREVDFVLKNGFEVKQLIQVTYASAVEKIESREIKSLIAASKELNCKNLLVITWDYKDETKIDNKTIRFLPLWLWLYKY